MKLLINGQLIDPNDYEGAAGTSIDIDLLDTETKKSVQQEYTLTGSAYELIEGIFILPDDGKNAFVPVKIYEDSCCDEDILLFEGILRGDMVSWCYGVCSVDVTFIQHTEETKKLDCIKSKLVYDNENGFQQLQHPRVMYCNEMRPDLLQHCILILGIGMNFSLTLATPLVAVVSVIVDVINGIINFINGIGANIETIGGFDGNTNTSLLQEWGGFRDSLNQRIIGCGRKHPSPFVRDYIINVCNICGVDFVSSIYNDPASEYYNAMYLSAPIEKGVFDDGVTMINQNFPIKTLDAFLDDLVLVHNGRWELIGSTLYFERKDFFWNGDVWVSFAALNEQNRIKGELCLQWSENERPAFITLNYSLDPTDLAGNEAKDRYNDIVEWNQPFNETQKGHTDILLPFGTARFRNDGINEDILGQYQGAPFGLGAIINQHQSTLILEKGTCFQPKLLIWSQESMTTARVKRYNIPGFEIGEGENYNFPYLFNEFNTVPNTAYPSDYPQTGLYPRFYSIDNPKLIIDEGKSFTFTMLYDCTTLTSSTNARYVQLPIGIGRINKMQVSLQDKTITVSGDV